MITNNSAEPTTNSVDAAVRFECARPSDLSDNDLLASTRRLVGRSNQLLAALLLHLGEVETRGLHRIRACASLYTYCIYELRFSEDEAFRRVAAARLIQRFPALFDAIASGELHLTGLLMLGPHLTPENVGQVLVRARHRTKKEIARLVRELAPLPDVPARIEPLGPAPARSNPNSPTWEQWTASLCSVRELTPGDRPRDWADGPNDAQAVAPSDFEVDEVQDSSDAPAELSRLSMGLSESPGALHESPVPAPARAEAEWRPKSPKSPQESESPAPAPARAEATAPLGAQRYRVEFTADEEYVALVERAKALLSHSLPNAGLEEIQLRAMRALVAELEKRKYAVTTQPRRRSPDPAVSSRSPAAPDSSTPDSSTPDSSTPDSSTPDSSTPDSSTPDSSTPDSQALAREQECRAESSSSTWIHISPRQRGRHVPAAVRRTVFERDRGRCSYVDGRG